MTKPVDDDNPFTTHRDISVTGTAVNPVAYTSTGMKASTRWLLAALAASALLIVVATWWIVSDDSGMANSSQIVTPVASASTAQIIDEPLPSNDPGGTTAEPSIAPAPAKNVKCGTKPTFTAKVKDDHVNGDEGPEFSGTACLPAGHSVYAFDKDSGDGLYYMVTVDDTNTNGPIITKSGNWDFQESNIGDPGDQDKLTTVTFVLANRGCRDYLNTVNTDEDDTLVLTGTQVTSHGCKIVSGVKVWVTN